MHRDRDGRRGKELQEVCREVRAGLVCGKRGWRDPEVSRTSPGNRVSIGIGPEISKGERGLPEPNIRPVLAHRVTAVRQFKQNKGDSQ